METLREESQDYHASDKENDATDGEAQHGESAVADAAQHGEDDDAIDGEAQHGKNATADVAYHSDDADPVRQQAPQQPAQIRRTPGPASEEDNANLPAWYSNDAFGGPKERIMLLAFGQQWVLSPGGFQPMMCTCKRLHAWWYTRFDPDFQQWRKTDQAK